MSVVSDIQGKKGKEPIVMLTAYSAPTAAVCRIAEVDIILVGDSLAMTFLGMDSTLEIGVEEMSLFVSAVRRGAGDLFVVADMPFGSYGISDEKSVENALVFVKKAGANAVKLEGTEDKIISAVKAMRAVGIEVMGHIGLTPQSLVNRSGFKVQGRLDEGRKRILEDGRKLQDAGCFSIVLECVPEPLGKELADSLSIPVIGIGAGRYVDGQVLVFDDVVGGFEKFKPKFVKAYGSVWEEYLSSARKYAADVRSGKFPSEGNVY